MQLANVGSETSPSSISMNSLQLILISATTVDNILAGHLQPCEPTTTVRLLLKISITFGVLLEIITLDDEKKIKKDKNVRFIDSFKMMKSSLKTLVEILPRDVFGILASVFPNMSSTELKVSQQRYYQYLGVRGGENINEKSLPPLNDCRNTVEGNAVTITLELSN